VTLALEIPEATNEAVHDGTSDASCLGARVTPSPSPLPPGYDSLGEEDA
jgi:hypothetical protein